MLTKLAGLKRYLTTGALGLLAIAITWGLLNGLSSRPVSEQMLRELSPCVKQALRPVAGAGAVIRQRDLEAAQRACTRGPTAASQLKALAD